MLVMCPASAQLEDAFPAGQQGPDRTGAQQQHVARVDQLDLAFISANFLSSDEEVCCPSTEGVAGAEPLTEISIGELRARGLGNLGRQDADGDGLLSLADIAAILQAGSQRQPSPKHRTRERSRR